MTFYNNVCNPSSQRSPSCSVKSDRQTRQLYYHTHWLSFHYKTYVGISQYIPHAVVLQVYTNGVHFRAVWENTAHVQGIRCSPKGSHLIPWTSAVFLNTALK